MTTPSVIADLELQLAGAKHDLAFVHYRACLAAYMKEAQKGVSIEEFRTLETLSAARHALSDHIIALEHHVTKARGRPVAAPKDEAAPPPPPKVVTKPVTKTKAKA